MEIFTIKLIKIKDDMKNILRQGMNIFNYNDNDNNN